MGVHRLFRLGHTCRTVTVQILQWGLWDTLLDQRFCISLPNASQRVGEKQNNIT